MAVSTLPAAAARTIAAGIILLAAGCGRLQFDARADANHDGDNTGCATAAIGSFQSGSGSTTDPFIICSAAQFAAIGQQPSSWQNYFRLAQDLDLANVPLVPIGSKDQPFTGGFDGAQHTMRNVAVAVGDNGGIFGFTAGADIGNLDLRSVAIQVTANSANVGLLVGSANNTTIHDVVAQGAITATTATYTAAGLVGYYAVSVGNSRISDISVEIATVNAVDLVGGLAGGLLVEGSAGCTIERVKTNVDIGQNTETLNSFGAFIGYIVVETGGQLSIAEGAARGTLTLASYGAFSGNFIGTLLARDANTIVNLTRLASTAALLTTSSYPTNPGRNGGLVGALGTSTGAAVRITRSYNAGLVHLLAPAVPLATNVHGGLFGILSAQTAGSIEVSDCSSSANIVADGRHSELSPGIGFLSVDATASLTLQRVLVSGQLAPSPTSNVTSQGGWIGLANVQAPVVAIDLWFDSDVNPVPAVGNGTFSSVTGKTHAELLTAATYASWDTAIWNVADGQLPTLRGLPTP